MASTANSRGEIVPGSKVTIKDNDTIYDVGEINAYYAVLYKDCKKIGKFPKNELHPVIY